MTVIVTSCVRPGDHPTDRNCVWIEEDHRSLNLENAADRHHLRDDAVTETDARAANQRSAPAVEDGLFLVPKVIE